MTFAKKCPLSRYLERIDFRRSPRRGGISFSLSEKCKRQRETIRRDKKSQTRVRDHLSAPVSLPFLESDSSYPFFLQNSCFASGNEGPARQEKTEFYGRTAAASGRREQCEVKSANGRAEEREREKGGEREIREKRDLGIA